MSIEKQIEKVKKEITQLEAYAVKDSSMRPPFSTNDISQTFDEIVEGIFSDIPEYWKRKERNGRLGGFDDPLYIKDLKKIRIRQKQSEEMKDEQIAYNEANYFLKAKEVITLAERGVNLANEGQYKEAITAFKTALQEVPGKNATMLMAPLNFNLGKAYLESGNFSNGLNYLLRYCQMQDEGDYYKSELDKLLNLEYKTITMNGEKKREIRGGTFQGEKFTARKSKVEFKRSVLSEDFLLHLFYKIPVNLELEMKKKEKITLLDYQYLNQIYQPLSTSSVFEISLPLGKFSDFMNEFYGTLLEYPAHFQQLQDFNTLYTELFVAMKLKQSLKYYERKELLPQLEEKKSIILVDVSAEKISAFLEDYKHFLSLFVLEQKTQQQFDEDEIGKIRKKYIHQQKLDIGEAWGQYQAEFYHHKKTSNEYARLRVLLHNLENDIPNPEETENADIYNQAQMEYWNLLDEAFSYFDVAEKVKQEKLDDFANLTFQKSELETLIKEQWQQMQKLVEIDSSAAIQRARIVIEAIIEEVFLIKGYSIVDENGRNLDLISKIEKIDYALNDETRSKLIRLRFKGNKCNHYEEIKRNYFGHFEQLTKEQAIQNLGYLRDIIYYLVRKFHL